MENHNTHLNIFRPFRRAVLICFFAGALSALSMAPLNLWVVLFATFPLLYLALTNVKNKREAFFIGWAFAFGYFVFGLYWIGNALLVEGNPYKWVWPLALIGLPAILSIFWGTATLLIYKFINLHKIGGWLGFCGILSLFEVLRGTLFTGFPWNLMGYTWADHLPLLQILRYCDIYTLSLLTMIWASTPALFFLHTKQKFSTAASVCVLSFGLIFGSGSWSLQKQHSTTKLNKNIEIRIVQPNIEQAEKWKRDKMAEHFRRQIDLSQNTVNSLKTTYIVWPETAFTYRYANDPVALNEIKTALSGYPGGAYLFTGMLRYDPHNNRYANSLVMIDKTGAITNIYDKHHLVPFGEYIPLAQWIPLRPIVEFNGFKPGKSVTTMSTPEKLKYSPLICYEIIFPYAGLYAKQDAPDFIINVTNDAWYGISAGPYQHFVQSQFRAIENGVPVIRAANTGFSGIIDPTGHVHTKTSLYTTETSVLPLPERTSAPLPQKTKLLITGLALLATIGLGIRKKTAISKF